MVFQKNVQHGLIIVPDIENIVKEQKMALHIAITAIFTNHKGINMKTIGITGGTGFVGKHLTKLLINNGYKVIVFTTSVARKPAKGGVSYAHWDPYKGSGRKRGS